MDFQKTAKAFSEILIDLGIDLKDKNLKDTPNRLAKLFISEITANTNKEIPENLFTVFPNEKKYDEIIMMDNIPFTSFCSHHFLPFNGLAWLLYIPDKFIVGASKPARGIEFFSKKPQIQENLGIEFLDFFERKIQPKGCMLFMKAIHSCMSSRGVKTGNRAGLTTSITRGVFRTFPELEIKGMQMIDLSIKLSSLI